MDELLAHIKHLRHELDVLEIGPDAMVSVGGTTYAIWPCLHGVGTS